MLSFVGLTHCPTATAFTFNTAEIHTTMLLLDKVNILTLIISQDGPLGPRGLAEATEMCTQECLVLGHSDNCWMPPSLGPYQQPKSPLSTFAPQKEWAKKDKLVNGHTLTRTWKEDSNRNQFSDRKQYGSSEGHFNTGNHMTDIPLANLKSYKQASGAVESPKEHQL
ncbi:protocadherin-9-like protein [Willisornis vidua]|uniref:Protocadherin-9-like protein n=1 Tax=Willisornis vidua TaxID=1566151 RepID=A0ABQ9DQ81_9PASS|nr:protocadherin-9-like protein [Willisornis vidua]